ERSNYALAVAVTSLNSDVIMSFFCHQARLLPVGINQNIPDYGEEFLGKFDKKLQEAAIRHQ
ncbi:IS481 family transposase, partial [Escherichia coli]|nr:IS481 family transposase [Escherichia coli]